MSPKSDHQKNPSQGRKVIYLKHKLLRFIPEVMVSMTEIFAKGKKAAV